MRGRIKAIFNPDGDGENELTIVGSGLSAILAFLAILFAIDVLFNGGQLTSGLLNIIG